MTPTIAVAHLWKVFGPRPERVVGSPLADLSRAELRTRTGCLAAVRDVSFDVRPGEVFVVMGLSGSGKSTLVRCLTRLIEPTSGEISIDGEPVRAMNAKRLRDLRRRRVAMVFQHFGLLPHRKVIDNVATVPLLTGVPKKEAHARALELLDTVGLDRSLANRYPSQLSGGQQQRVGVARGLAVDPNILLMDEPFGAVDPIVRADLQQELTHLQRELDKTVVFVTHDIDEAFLLGDQVVILQKGAKIAQQGHPREILANPANDFVANFIGADRGKRRLVPSEGSGTGDDVLLLDGAGYAAGVVKAPGGKLAYSISDKTDQAGDA